MTTGVRGGEAPLCCGGRDAECCSQKRPGLWARTLDRSIPPRARRDRASCGTVVGRGSGHPVDAGCEPGQVAPRTHHMVLRDIPDSAEYAGLQTLRWALRVP